MRGLWSTLGLVVVLAGLGGYIYFVDSKRPASTGVEGEPARAKFFTVEADKVNEIKLTYKGQTTLVRKSDGGWKMIEPVAVDADPPEVIGMAQAISNIESVREVVDNPSDLKQFGLAEPQIAVEWKAEGGAAGSFKLGNKNPTQSDIYAIKGGDTKVVLVSSFQESSFNKEPFALRDKKILKFDRDKADSLSLVKGASAIELSRAGSATVSLLLGKDTPEGDVYAKDASRPIVFTVEKALADDVSQAPAAFRSKDVFAFRAFTGTRLEIAKGGQTFVFERRKGPEKDAVEKWVQVQPAKNVEEAKIEDLVGKVATLRAESFVDALPAGATELARIQTAFDEGRKKESVVLHQAGADYYAVRDGDAGAAKLIAPAVTDAVAALEATQK